MKNEFLTGLIAAPFTPMDKEGNINLEIIQNYADFLVNSGVSGAFVCGTTGEGASLSADEKRAVIDEWIRCSGQRLKIIAHVGGTCQAECADMAAHASQRGADAVAAMAPFFFKPETAEDLLHFLKPVAEAASGLPFYYYHIPSMTGFNLPVHQVLKQAADIIPNFTGVKYTHSDMMDLQQCLRVSGGRYELLFGSDEILISGLNLGLNSAVGSTYNYMAPWYLELIEAFDEGDVQKAREYQQFSVQVVEVLMKYGGGVRGGKAIMELAGIACGSCRPPLKPMAGEEKELLQKDLQAIGFFEKIETGTVKAR